MKNKFEEGYEQERAETLLRTSIVMLISGYTHLNGEIEFVPAILKDIAKTYQKIIKEEK